MQKMIKISSAIASGALIASLLAPAAFASDVTITGNGNKSTNTVILGTTNNTTVSQSNTTVVNTSINSTASTGGNSASKNTGGSNGISTGAATSTVGVTVVGGGNTATVDPCGCDDPDTTVLISDNGNKSKNKVVNKNTNNLIVGQANVTVVNTGVNSKAKTGNNKSNKNTGGANTIGTGPADSTVDVLVVSPANTLNP